jgi:hypothetical protein
MLRVMRVAEGRDNKSESWSGEYFMASATGSGCSR